MDRNIIVIALNREFESCPFQFLKGIRIQNLFEKLSNGYVIKLQLDHWWKLSKNLFVLKILKPVLEDLDGAVAFHGPTMKNLTHIVLKKLGNLHKHKL